MVITETYNRGRREMEVRTCFFCMISVIKKGRKLANNTGKGIISKGCTVKWGKDKTSKFDPKKKDKPKKRKGY